MKKLLTVLVLAALVCSLSGCGIGFGGWNFGFGSTLVYDHASKYTIGDGKVDWMGDDAACREILKNMLEGDKNEN